MWILLLSLGIALSNECPSPATSGDLTTDIAAAKTAFAALDADAFLEAHDGALAHLYCLGELINPFDAASFHRMVAMEAFLREDRPATLRAFAASLAVQPEFALPERIAPLGHPLREQYEAAHLMALDFEEPLGGPPDTFTYVDGQRSVVRPLGRPLVLQLLSTTGRVHHTTYLHGSEPTPSWAMVVESVAETTEEPAEAPVFERMDTVVPSPDRSGFLATRKARWQAAAITGGAAAVLYGGSWGTRAVYDNNPSNGMYYATNGQVVASATVSAVAVGLVAGALFAGEKTP